MQFLQVKYIVKNYFHRTWLGINLYLCKAEVALNPLFHFIKTRYTFNKQEAFAKARKESRSLSDFITIFLLYLFVIFIFSLSWNFLNFFILHYSQWLFIDLNRDLISNGVTLIACKWYAIFIIKSYGYALISWLYRKDSGVYYYVIWSFSINWCN